MEKKVFKFGAGSYAMVVPKAWAERNGIVEKSVVDAQIDAYGNLVLSTRGAAAREAELQVSRSLKPEVAARWVGIYYRSGVKRLRVYFRDGATKEQLSGIEGVATRLCPGFEVTKRSREELILEDFTDIKEVSVDKVVSRIRSLISEELSEMSAGADTGEVAKLEGLVDRFFMLGVRQVNMTQGRDSLKQLKMLQLLETISDQLCEISKGGARGIEALFDQLHVLLDTCFKALEGGEEAVAKAIEERDAAFKAIGKAKASDLDAYLLREVAKNMAKVAEFGLVGENGVQF